jgi:hypothetical protein
LTVLWPSIDLFALPFDAGLILTLNKSLVFLHEPTHYESRTVDRVWQPGILTTDYVGAGTAVMTLAVYAGMVALSGSDWNLDSYPRAQSSYATCKDTRLEGSGCMLVVESRVFVDELGEPLAVPRSLARANV